MEAVYATRERVMRAADIQASAYMNAQIDDRLISASRRVDRLCHRGDGTRPGFAPWTGSISFDWPRPNNESPSRFWLNQNALYSLSSVNNAGTGITSSCLLRPETGPPYSSVIVNQASGNMLRFNTGVGEESLIINGVWCGCPVEENNRGTLNGNINASVTTAVLNAPLGVGALIRIDSERMIVTDRAWATSGQTGTLTANLNAQLLAVADGTVFFVGEELILDAERVLINAITGNTLLVQRGQGGTALAAHTGATIFWSRTFTIQRASMGTAAASHTSGASVFVYKPPALIEQLTVAYAIDQGEQENSAYARTVTTNEDAREIVGRGLVKLEDAVWSAYGRKLRHRGI